MTHHDAKRLKLHDKVYTDKLPPGEHHEGEVIEVGYCAVKIQWNDGQIGVLDTRDCEQIHRLPVSTKKG